MKIDILDTYRLYTEMMLLPDAERTAFFDEKVMQPFSLMYKMMNMPRDPGAFGCLALTGNDEAVKAMLTRLQEADAWNKAHRAINQAGNALQKSGIPMPNDLVFGLFLADPMIHADSKGYTGVGSCPGIIQVMIAPNEYNLPRLASCVAHEFHHNVLFYNVKWNFMNVSLSQYLAVEGLAESLAAELYGEEFNGPWVADIGDENLKRARGILGQHLDSMGFMEVRKYMYGDHPMVPEGQTLGIPYCAGYAVGYHAVQEYLRKTSKTVSEATKDFINGEDIVKKSGYFG